MSKKVFISYCHAQGDWVLNRLAECPRRYSPVPRTERVREPRGLRESQMARVD